MENETLHNKVQFARIFYSYFQFDVQPPQELLAQCKAIKKRCTTRRMLAEYIISLCKDTDQLEGLAVICEACDWAGADMAQETIFWTEKILAKMDTLADVPEATNASRHAVIYSFLGKALQEVKRFDEALDAFEKSYHYSDTYACLCHIVDLLVRAKRFDDALNLLEESRDRHLNGTADPLPILFPGTCTARQRSRKLIHIRNVLCQIDLKSEEITLLQAEADNE